MSHRSLFWPIALIAAVALTLLMITFSTPVSLGSPVMVVPTLCATDGTAPSYPHCIQTKTAEAATPTTEPIRILKGCPTDGPTYSPPYPPYADCLKTRTALLLQTEVAGYTATPIPAANNRSANTSTPTYKPTEARTHTPIVETQPTAVRSSSPVATVGRTTPTPTPSEGLEDRADAVLCVPGSTIPVEGSADPRIGLIVLFGTRPVGGGFSRDDGSYRIWLHIGDERPGIYSVEVQERATSETVQTFLCQVPGITPTPTPTLTLSPTLPMRG